MNVDRPVTPESSFKSNGEDSLISQETMSQLRSKGAKSAELPPIPPSPSILSPTSKGRRGSGSSASIRSVMGTFKRKTSFEFLTRPVVASNGNSSAKEGGKLKSIFFFLIK